MSVIKQDESFEFSWGYSISRMLHLHKLIKDWQTWCQGTHSKYCRPGNLQLISVSTTSLCHYSEKVVIKRTLPEYGCILTKLLNTEIWIFFYYFHITKLFSSTIKKCKTHSWLMDYTKTQAGPGLDCFVKTGSLMVNFSVIASGVASGSQHTFNEQLNCQSHY